MVLTQEFIFRVLGEYGVPIALVVFFVWRDYKREGNLSITIRKLEDEMRVILKEQVTTVTKALTNNTACMREFITMLRTRPCIATELAEALIRGRFNGYKEEVKETQP
jgi:hypothetical protein